MQLTTQLLEAFINGQLEIQNQIEGYIYRGEIENVDVTNNELNVVFKWLAKGNELPLPSEWINENNKTYSLNLEMSNINDIDELGRIILNSAISNDLLVFYPPNGSKLNPKEIKGLVLVQA